MSEAAFPFTSEYGNVMQEGMSLRDYFAAKAMQAEISRIGYYPEGEHMDRAAQRAYLMADAMLKARDAK